MAESSKILIVDDEPLIRELLTEVLTGDGYTVVSASSGNAALAILRESDDFVLLFTDILMPGMNGIELVREARKLRPTIIPIVMTAYATIDTARAAVKEGAYDYVLKPFPLSEIKLAVSNAIDRHRLTSENARLLELTQLFNISEQIATMRDEQQLLDFVLRAALDRVNANRGSIMVTADDDRSLAIKASIGVPDDIIQQPVEALNSISGLVVRTAQPLLVSDLRENPEVEQMSHRRGDSSFVSVPLERKGFANGGVQGVSDDHRVVAVLNVSQKRDGSTFTEGDLKILSIMANHAAAALQNARLIHDIERSHLSTIESMALLLEARDPYTRFHSQRVRDISVTIAGKRGMSQQDIEVLRIGAAFHDIGKVGVPDMVLNKPDRLTDEEWQLIRKHPVIGYGVLEPIHFLKKGHLDIVRCHHERIDGSGYPDGLMGDNVSPLVRIIAVADSYDAMASDRAYRAAWPPAKVASELRISVGKGQLDVRVVELLIGMLESGEINHVG